MHNNKKTFACLSAVIVMLACIFMCGSLNAQSLSLNKQADMNFGTIDFLDTTAAGNITLGTNGVVTYGSTTSGSGSGVPGQLEITGTPGTTVEISCSADATLPLTGNGTLSITPVNFVIGATNVTSYNGGIPCSGIGASVATHTITATSSENTIFIGGNLNTNGVNLHNGTFTSSNSGGTQPAFRILVQ